MAEVTLVSILGLLGHAFTFVTFLLEFVHAIIKFIACIVRGAR